MAEFHRPATYIDKLLFAQRVIKTAQFRTDHKQSLRELCEAMTELVVALIEREQGRDPKPKPAESEPKPAS